MGIFLVITFISLVVAGLAKIVNSNYKDSGYPEAVLGFIITYISCSIIPIMILCSSYGSYVDIRTQYDATINQYRDAVTMYSDCAKIDVDKAFTDFKYQGYQENIAGFIKSLRRQVINYNEKLISKRVMNKNFFLNWVIVMPDDDMKILSLTKGVKE